uniref:hypothetical protein n=1 Tax=Pseudomonas palleroniana TaxID=191390 RepID=UPI00131A2634|nr:hypothetical protein [Pseudomonas palleroniana]
MTHTQNIIEFKKAFSCGSDLVESYCRLIAIELRLADIKPLKSHHIINKLQNLSQSTAGSPHSGALSSRISELTTAFNNIYVESIKGTGTLSLASYPNVRYTRFTDDWPADITDHSKITDLNNVIKNTMQTLKALGKAI